MTSVYPSCSAWASPATASVRRAVGRRSPPARGAASASATDMPRLKQLSTRTEKPSGARGPVVEPPRLPEPSSGRCSGLGSEHVVLLDAGRLREQLRCPCHQRRSDPPGEVRLPPVLVREGVEDGERSPVELDGVPLQRLRLRPGQLKPRAEEVL